MATATASEMNQSTEDTSWLDAFSILDPKAYLNGFLEKDTRPDGRLLYGVRPTVIHKSTLTKNSVGSALVKLGQTQVLGAVTLQVGQPSAAAPNEGDVQVVLQQQSNDGGDDDESWIQSLLQRHVLNVKDLCIKEGKAAWRLVVVLQVLNEDGNVKDAAFLAALAALADTKLPTNIVWNNDKVELSDQDECVALKLNKVAVPLSIGLYKDSNEKIIFLVDPSPLESQLLEGTITLVATTNQELVSVNYVGNARLSIQEISKCAHMAFGRAEELTGLLLE